MMRAGNMAWHAMHLALLRCASLMVPLARRAEWYREWSSELWHVRRSCVPIGVFSWRAEYELAAFCAGSFQDAVYLRREERETAAVPASVHGSARQCVLWLCTVVALCALIARFLPGIQSEKDAARVQLAPGLILIQEATEDRTWKPTVPFIEYRDWSARRQRFFTDLAFYRMELESAGDLEGQEWRVAHGSANLFKVLGVQRADYAEDGPGLAQGLLSRSMWRRAFRSDPSVIGRVVTIARRKIRIAGIAPAGTWELPGHADIWLTEADAWLRRLPRTSPGYVLGLLSPLGLGEVMGGVINIAAFGPGGQELEYWGTTFVSPTDGPLAIYLFSLILAIFALPAITSVFRSESSFASHQPPLKTRAKRWAFLCSKVGLAAGLGYFGGLDIAYWNFPDYSPSAEFLQFAAGFSICLFGLRWAVVDQSRRCPVCLRRVTHPAQVGIASCNFLGWNGTEMICMGGHALLHVPSLPTSWFGRQRWMYLDISWGFLFADAAPRE